MKVSKMGVGQVGVLVERAYRESGRMQFVRELYKNAIEAGATRVEFGVEPQGMAHGRYRLMIADNGVGMDSEEIERFLNTFGGGGKPIGDAHENYGVGVKTSTLPWNRAGLVVVSKRRGRLACMVWMCASEDGDYGARQFDTDDGFVEVVAPFEDLDTGIDWAQVLPDWIQDQGTAIVCLGNTLESDTFLEKGLPGVEPFEIFEITKYLNTRVWSVPKGVTVRVAERRSNDRKTWPGTGLGLGAWAMRSIKGARRFVEDDITKGSELEDFGTVGLDDGTQVDWYLRSEQQKTHGYAESKGYIAALYQDELYDVKTHHATFRRFGITPLSVLRRVTLVVTPPQLEGGVGVYPDTARSSLRRMGSKHAGEGLPWDEWGEEFGRKLPRALVEAIHAEVLPQEGTLRDDKWKHRIASRFGKRWKRTVLRLDEAGTSTTTPGEGGSRPSRIRSASSGSGRPGGAGGRSGEHTKGQEGPGQPAKPINSPGGVPDYRWASGDEFPDGDAAMWERPNRVTPQGRVVLNSEFGPLREVVEYWQKQFPEHLLEPVQAAVQEVYGEAMVARIAHSEALTRDPAWGRKRVDAELRSGAALTMAVLGLVAEDMLIAQRVRKLGPRSPTQVEAAS